ncbi:hypothetical protein AVEN_102124-1, partial [Araneus ventricosus]
MVVKKSCWKPTGAVEDLLNPEMENESLGNPKAENTRNQKTE